MNKSRQQSGFFVTFEGGEGTGKSSQIQMLKQKLEKQGHDVVVTREPGGTKGAEIMRHVILRGAAERFGPETEAILFAAARADHVEQVIAPALASGKTVLCDRFFDSTRVYQGKSGKVDMQFLQELEEVTCENAWPDLTLLFDLDVETSLERASKRRKRDETPDRFEKEPHSEQEFRRKAFLELAEQEPVRIKVVDASGTKRTVFNRIWKIVENSLHEVSGTKNG